MIKNFEELFVWQKAHRLTKFIYQITRSFPQDERFGLTSQIRRSSISVENNIAEGFGRRTTKDFINFLYKSLGSLLETRSMVRLSNELRFINQKDYEFMLEETIGLQMMIKKLIGVLKKKETPII